MDTIIFATGNKNKMIEIRMILAVSWLQDLVPERSRNSGGCSRGWTDI